MERQREAYASNPQKREEKRKRNEKAKKNQEMFRQEQKKEWRKKDAKQTVLCFENSMRLNNKMRYESNFEWISDCFKHFFETFKDIDDKTKNKLIILEKGIIEKYSSNESEIDEMTKNAKEGAEQYNGDYYPNHFNCDLFFKKGNQYPRKFYDEECNVMKKTTLNRLDEIFDQVEEPFKETDWHISLRKINRIYADKIYGRLKYGRTMDGHFLEEKFCVICKDRAHRISFDPELAAKSKTYTYYGTSEVEKAH